MKEQGHSLSFGRYLRKIRQEKGLRLEDVGRETRIGIETLNLIEREDISSLPEEVFVKGFLRSYAKAVGAEGDIAVASYLKSLAIVKRSMKTEADLTGLPNRFWPNLLLTAVALMVLMASSILLTGVFWDKPSPPPAPSPPRAASVAAQPPAAPAPGPEESTPAPVPVVAPVLPVPQEAVAPISDPQVKTQVLEITAVEETWMKIVIDDEKTKDVILKPGDRISLEASVGFNLLVGNVAGVTMSLNGQPVPLTGRSGQVKTVRLP